MEGAPRLKKLKVDVQKILSVVREHKEIVVSEQAGYYKCQAAKGRQVYIARTQEVGRVDISGFEVPSRPGIKDLRGESFGAVRQQLDFGGEHGEDVVLSALKDVCSFMVALPAAEKQRRKFEPKPVVQAQPAAAGTPGTEVEVVDPKLSPWAKLDDKQKAIRLELIKDTHRRQLADGTFYRRREHPATYAGISPATVEALGGAVQQ